MTEYSIVREPGLDETPYLVADYRYLTVGKPTHGSYRYATFDDAASYAAELNGEYRGYYHRVIPFGTPMDAPAGWQDRELRRFALGEYAATPWDLEPWYATKRNEHFCHMSAKQPGMVAYTENEAKGAADRQTQTRAGRYLTKFFSDVLTANEIEAWAAKVSVEAGERQLHITQDADEIEAVYVSGPNSCMSYEARHFSGHCHPVRVYAGPDLALAYTGAIDDAKGRALVWPAKKQYGRIYGDESRMKLLLAAEGYEPGNFTGAQLRRIQDSNGQGLIMPYVDRVPVYDDGETLVIGDSSHGYPIETDNQRGLADNARDDRPSCDHCGDPYEEDDGEYLDHRDEYWCSHCADNYASRCEYDNNLYAINSVSLVEVHSSNTYSRFTSTSYVHPGNLDDYGAVLTRSGDYWHQDHTYFCDELQEDCSVHDDGEPIDWDGDTLCLEGAEKRMAEQDADEVPIAHIEAYRALPRPAPAQPVVTPVVVDFAARNEPVPTLWEVMLTREDGDTALCTMWNTRGRVSPRDEAERTRRELSLMYPRCTYTVQPAGTFAASQQLALAA
jgi:hypothetical protein